MPRHNRTPKHTLFIRSPPSSETAKTRYSSKQQALRAIKELKKYHLDSDFAVYQSPQDGGWYLTSQSVQP